jgi:hypothetical protein
MQPITFPIVAEARMAERLLEVERERLARAAATTPVGRGRKPPPEPSSSAGARPRLTRALGIALAGCLVLAGAVLGETATQAPTRLASVPTHVLTRTSVAVSGEWRCLSGGYCQVRMNDARVSGAGPTLVSGIEARGDGRVTATLSVPGPDGEWIGSLAAVRDARVDVSEILAGVGQIPGAEGTFTLWGTGAYEGWAFVGSWRDPLNGDPAGCTGLIAKGEAPGLSASPCGVPAFGWVPGTAAPLIDATLLRRPVLLPVCPLP